MNNLVYLFRQGWASLRKDMGFVASVLVTMGVTIGVSLLVATLSYFLLLRPLPYADQERLYNLQYQRTDHQGEVQTGAFLYPAAEQLYKSLLKQRNGRLEQHALLYFAKETLTSEETQPRLTTAYVSAEVGDMLGVPLVRGSWFPTDQAIGGQNRGAVISHATWKQQFGGREDILSRSIIVNDVSHPILGVVGPDFVAPQLTEIGASTELWLPWVFNNSSFKDSWSIVDTGVFMMAKLKGDPTQLTRLASSMSDEQFQTQIMGNANFKGWHARLNAQSLRDAITSRSMGALKLMALGAVGLLLISTANIINLFLSRTVSKQKQLGISASLGARRSHLWQALFAETFIVMMLAAGAGLLLAVGGCALIQHLFGDNLARANELGLTFFTVACALGLALILAAIISGFAIRIVDYRNLSLSLRGSGKGTAVQVSARVRKGLIASQVSIAVMLVFFSASLIQASWVRLNRPIGFESANVVRIEFDIATLDFLGWNAYVPKVKELGDKLRALPEVQSVSFARSPLEDIHQFAITYNGTGTRYYPFHRSIDYRYLDVVGQKLVVGNGFQAADVQSRTNVAMINETFARELGGDVASVIGKKLAVDSIPPATIIGVVQDVQVPGKQVTPPRFYVPNLGTALWMLVKLKPGASLPRDQVVKLMAGTDRQFALTELSLLERDIAKAKFSHLATLVTAVVLGAFTVFLACVGLFGIMNYSAQARSTEFSIKLAIGAKHSHILIETLVDNTSVLLVGIALGTAAILGLGIYFSEALAGHISWSLLGPYLSALALIAAVTMVSCMLPLRKLKNTPIIHGLRGVN